MIVYDCVLPCLEIFGDLVTVRTRNLLVTELMLHDARFHCALFRSFRSMQSWCIICHVVFFFVVSIKFYLLYLRSCFSTNVQTSHILCQCNFKNRLISNLGLTLDISDIKK